MALSRPERPRHRRARSVPAPSDDPVSMLLALSLSFMTIESALGVERPWLSLDLTMGQFKAIMLIVQTGGVPSSTMAEHLGTARSAITPLVDRLFDQKLVRRETDANDRRVVWIRPTSRALALHQALLQTRRPALERVWDELPADHRGRVRAAIELLLDSAERVIQSKNG